VHGGGDGYVRFLPRRTPATQNERDRSRAGEPGSRGGDVTATVVQHRDQLHHRHQPALERVAPYAGRQPQPHDRALPGAVGVLVGLPGLRRVRRLRRRGTRTWAEAAPLPGSPHLMALRYILPDEHVMEKLMGGKAALLPGERVLIWYDVAAGAVTGILGP
jgi:hypothetical protein